MAAAGPHAGGIVVRDFARGVPATQEQGARNAAQDQDQTDSVKDQWGNDDVHDGGESYPILVRLDDGRRAVLL